MCGSGLVRSRLHLGSDWCSNVPRHIPITRRHDYGHIETVLKEANEIDARDDDGEPPAVNQNRFRS
jgi:hypothetical protein